MVVKTNSHPGDPYSLKIEVRETFWKCGLHLKRSGLKKIKKELKKLRRSGVKMLRRMLRQMTPGSIHVQLETSSERL